MLLLLLLSLASVTCCCSLRDTVPLMDGKVHSCGQGPCIGRTLPGASLSTACCMLPIGLPRDQLLVVVDQLVVQVVAMARQH